MNMPKALNVPEISVTVDEGRLRVEVMASGSPRPKVKPKRILLSQANVTDLEVQAVTRAVKSGWVTPLGPEVDGFESDIRRYVDVANAVALSSGTAALHLGLLGLGVQPGDEVIVPTLTFGATAFAVTYTGARPLLLDVEERSWGLDPDLLAEVLEQRARSGRQVAAIIPVDLFGIPADYDRILAVAGQHGVPVLIDAAEALGARHRDRAAGTIGQAGIYSFNGNKIMTTSGGGMLVSDDRGLIEKARFRSTQSREPFPFYWHEEIGYNYRMSNVLAALGRAQLQRLPDMIARRQSVRRAYTELLGDLEGVQITQDPSWATGNAWLSTARFNRDIHPGAADRVRIALEAQDIETRPIWKPMHHQPVFAATQAFTTGTADRLFEEGLCLPSGVGLSDSDIERVAEAIRGALAQG